MCILGIGKKMVECLLFEFKGKLGVDLGVVFGGFVVLDDVVDVFNVLLVLGYFDKEVVFVIK